MRRSSPDSKAAGAVILGKLQLTEGAYADHHPEIDPPRNPWDGDALVRAHLRAGPASRLPQDLLRLAGIRHGVLDPAFRRPPNSVTGLKPTWGRVSRYGVSRARRDAGPHRTHGAKCGGLRRDQAPSPCSDPNDPTAVLEPVPNYLANLSGSLRGTRIGVDPR